MGAAPWRAGMADAANAVVATNAELAERAALFRVCAECNSVNYTQRPIRSLMARRSESLISPGLEFLPLPSAARRRALEEHDDH
jgi:hypothetical protein